MENMELLSKNIKEALENAKPWQRVPTSEAGIFLIKAPTRGDQESLMVEINPLDDMGRPIKRRGIFLSNAKQLKYFKEVMNNPKTETVLKCLDYITGAANSNKDPTEQIKI